VRPEGLGKSEKKIHLIGTQTSDLPACSVEFKHYEITAISEMTCDAEILPVGM
jgi:hypothetical protein